MVEFAICEDCKKEMTKGNGCTITHVMFIDKAQLERVLYGRETRWDTTEGNNPCHDCNVEIGQIHHAGCDVEECPRCHLQQISCPC